MLNLTLLVFVVAAADAPLALELRVAPELRASFLLLPEENVPEAALEPLFTSLRAKGDTFCSMLHNQTPRKDDVATAFVDAGEWKRQKDTCRGCRFQVKAGCWNFFEMNDQHPEDDFELVKALFPGLQYDCYAVGMVQPYMMHNVLGCTNLSVVDFDWRIHDAHFQLLRKYRAGAMKDAAGLDAAVADVTIGWVAQTGRPKPSHPASVATFCEENQLAICRDHLLRFQETGKTLRALRLDLSALHEARYGQPGDTTSSKVIFLSNAIEDIYTKKAEFERFMLSLHSALAVGQKAYLIHHVGAHRSFGLYLAEGGAKAAKVSTICRDPYSSTATNKTPGAPYEIWLDGVTTTTKPPPRCHYLLDQARKKALKTP
ncbi:MAG: hypothetical protein Q8O67_09550 [Deltaproteobacteria bacterium]|nr:hypothetical protein [Deltaproteobacteria bacterium]